MKVVNGVGLNCPMPVIMTKKEYDNGERSLLVKVDNETACENLTRFAENLGGKAEVAAVGDIFEVSVLFEGAVADKTEGQAVLAKTTNDYVVFCGSEFVGNGNDELGATLMTMFFYTLTESEDLPSSICFMNGGVKLACENEQVIEHLKELENKGVEVVVCGACLNFFSLKNKVGKVGNMYEIVTKMQKTGKVIKP